MDARRSVRAPKPPRVTAKHRLGRCYELAGKGIFYGGGDRGWVLAERFPEGHMDEVVADDFSGSLASLHDEVLVPRLSWSRRTFELSCIDVLLDGQIERTDAVFFTDRLEQSHGLIAA